MIGYLLIMLAMFFFTSTAFIYGVGYGSKTEQRRTVAFLQFRLEGKFKDMYDKGYQAGLKKGRQEK